MKNIEKEFHRDLFKSYTESKKLGYKATRFLQMFYEYGAVETAKKLLSTDKFIQEGIVKLWELKRLDLSVEALVVEKKYKTLFSEDELKIARKRLQDLKYQ